MLLITSYHSIVSILEGRDTSCVSSFIPYLFFIGYSIFILWVFGKTINLTFRKQKLSKFQSITMTIKIYFQNSVNFFLYFKRFRFVFGELLHYLCQLRSLITTTFVTPFFGQFKSYKLKHVLHLNT